MDHINWIQVLDFGCLLGECLSIPRKQVEFATRVRRQGGRWSSFSRCLERRIGHESVDFSVILSEARRIAGGLTSDTRECHLKITEAKLGLGAHII